MTVSHEEFKKIAKEFAEMVHEVHGWTYNYRMVKMGVLFSEKGEVQYQLILGSFTTRACASFEEAVKQLRGLIEVKEEEDDGYFGDDDEDDDEDDD